MNRPLVSVIVPVYNGERYLTFALQSIFEQVYHPFEVIVVDDGSADRSADIARSFKGVRYIYQTNQGVAAARNLGISTARGEFIAFLDQDDVWTTNKLSVQVDYLLKHPQLGYTIANQRFFLEPETVIPPWLKKDLLLEDHPAFVPSALVVRKTVFERIGSFDAGYSMGSDSDWFARAKDFGIPMAIQPETLLLRRIHSHNNSSKVQAALSDMRRVVKASIERQRSRAAKVNNMNGNDNGK